MQEWPQDITDRIALETHFDGRLVKCFRDRPTDLNDMIAQAVRGQPQAEAVVSGNTRLTYAQLDTEIDQVARGLVGIGVVPSDRVAIILSNRAEFLIVLLASLRIGAIAVPINTREQTPELAHILNDCGAVVLVHDAESADKIPDAQAVPALTHRYCVDGAKGLAQDYAILRAPGGEPVRQTVTEEDTAVILYTSGTTGKPKGAMLTHFNIVHSSMHFEMCMALGQGERSLLAVPASHVTGLVATIFTMLRTAGCTVMMAQFQADAFLDLMSREKITQTLMVPAMYNLFLLRCRVEDYELSSWRVGGYGGAPMAEATIAALSDKLPRLDLVNAYGATELTSPATILPLGMGVKRADSIGIAVPCGEIRIVGEDGNDAAPDTPGELWIKGPMVVPGYWNNPEKTAQEFQDGFWKSGDVGSRDSMGFIRLHDRQKDMIIRGGYNIYSAEIENTLTAHPDIVECAAIGQPDPVLGEKLHVFVHSETNSLDADAVKAHCAAHLADYKTPDFVTFTEAPLPRNANGKVIKKTLRDALRENNA